MAVLARAAGAHLLDVLEEHQVVRRRDEVLPVCQRHQEAVHPEAHGESEGLQTLQQLVHGATAGLLGAQPSLCGQGLCQTPSACKL